MVSADPETTAYLKEFAGKNRWDLLPLNEAREAHKRFQVSTSTFSVEHETARRAVTTKNMVLGGVGFSIPVRIYRAPHLVGVLDLPLVVFFHGGGWVIGDLDTHDELCREISARVDAIVIAVEYRLAPEHRFPTAVDDSLWATRWIATHARELGGDSSRMALVGDSAGGNIAAVVSAESRGDDELGIMTQVLIYPVVDNSSEFERTKSVVEYGQGFELTSEGLRWFQNLYFGPDENLRDHPHASPTLADDFRGLPRTLLIVAEYDPIADSIYDYAKKLKENDVEVDVETFPGVMHAFVTTGAYFSAAARAADIIVEALRTALRRGE
jgi:acetyl esterase